MQVSQGYTIIELVTIMILLGILSAIALPRFEKSGYQDRFFSDQVLSTLRFAQQLAVSSGCAVQVALDANTIVLTQRQACTGNSFTQPVFNPITKSTTFEVTAPEEITLLPSQFPVIFDSLGRACDAIDQVFDGITIISVSNRRVFIVGETGYVYLR